MGSDIHLWVERRNDKGKWEIVPRDAIADAPDWTKPYSKSNALIFHDRNYDLFAILANVRNGHGFAGVKTSDGFKPIAMPRGVPEDASRRYKDEVRDWGVDGHSHSWLTLSELWLFDWVGQTTKKVGVISAGEYVAWKEEGGMTSPKSWCGSVSGGSCVTVSTAEMDRMLAEGTLTVSKDEAPESPFDGRLRARSSDGKNYYTQVEWFTTYEDAAGRFLKFIELLHSIQPPVTDANDLRLVFFFDN